MDELSDAAKKLIKEEFDRLSTDSNNVLRELNLYRWSIRFIFVFLIGGSIVGFLKVQDYVDERIQLHAKAFDRSIRQAVARLRGWGLAHIREGDLRDGFTARDIYRNQWAGLSDRDQTKAGLNLLEDFDWLRAERQETGGRERVAYRIHPEASA